MRLLGCSPRVVDRSRRQHAGFLEDGRPLDMALVKAVAAIAPMPGTDHKGAARLASGARPRMHWRSSSAARMRMRRPGFQHPEAPIDGSPSDRQEGSGQVCSKVLTFAAGDDQSEGSSADTADVVGKLSERCGPAACEPARGSSVAGQRAVGQSFHPNLTTDPRLRRAARGHRRCSRPSYCATRGATGFRLEDRCRCQANALAAQRMKKPHDRGRRSEWHAFHGWRPVAAELGYNAGIRCALAAPESGTCSNDRD